MLPETTNVSATDVAKLLAAMVILSAFSSLALRCRRSSKLRRRRRRSKKHPDDGSVIPADSVLYSPSIPQHNCEDEYDVILVGSGIGGLTAASLLAQRGYSVLVLEQHSVCGGCCHSFVSGGYRFGTGIHYVGDVGGDHPTMAKSILAAITYPDDPIQWDSLPENYDTLFLGNRSTSRLYKFVGAGWRGQKRIFKEQFPPEDHAAIDEYYDLVHKAAASWMNAILLKFLPPFFTKFFTRTGLYRLFAGDYCKYASMTLKDVVTSLTDNKDLQAAMCYNWGDHGCDPSRAPFVLHSGLVAHYVHGAYYPRGGTQNIARKIIPTITDFGGKVLAHAPVKGITVNRWTGGATGVEMKGGRRIRARRAVISDAGLFDTLHHLLPPTLKARNELIDSLFGAPVGDSTGGLGGGKEAKGKLHTSVTGLYVAVGLQGDHDDDLHLPHTQHWAYSSPDGLLAHTINAMSLEEGLQLKPEDFFLFITSPSAKDSGWKDEFPDKSTVEIMTFVPSEWFRGFTPRDASSAELGGLADPGGKPESHGARYEAVKKTIAELMWTRAVEVLESSGATNLPATLKDVDHYQVGSPLTFAHYYRREGGPWYGTDNDMARYDPKTFLERIRPDSISEIPGLYLTGQDASAPGFVGSMIGGLLCASKVAGVINPFSLVEVAGGGNPFPLAEFSGVINPFSLVELDEGS